MRAYREERPLCRTQGCPRYTDHRSGVCMACRSQLSCLKCKQTKLVNRDDRICTPCSLKMKPKLRLL